MIKKHAPKHTAVPKPSPLTTQRQLGKSAKPNLENSKPTCFVVSPHRMQSLLERVSDFLVIFFWRMCGADPSAN